MKTLLPIHRDTLQSIINYYDTEGFAPSVRDLAKSLNVGSTAIYYRLKVLRSYGYITWRDGTARSIRVLKMPD